MDQYIVESGWWVYEVHQIVINMWRNPGTSQNYKITIDYRVKYLQIL